MEKKLMIANELRIGNWIMDMDGDINQIEDLNPIKNGYVYRWEWLKYLSPIPLTEEWLLMFGFEKDEDSCIFEKNGIEIFRNRNGIDGRQRFEYISMNINPDLDYVHQLQNLYFALTGEELEIK